MAERIALQTIPTRTRGRRLLACLLALVVQLFAFTALADTEDGPIITAGREKDIVALVVPYGDKEIVPGWKLDGIDVQIRFIRFVLAGPAAKKATIRVDHPERAPRGAEKTASFALVREAGCDDPGAAPAVAELMAAIRRNDKGEFWAQGPPPTVVHDDGSNARAYDSRYADGGNETVPSLRQMLRRAPSWLGDGVVLFLAAVVLTLVHLKRVLREEPRWIPWSLFGLVVLGAALRIVFAREAPMNAWPYERVVPLAQRSFDGAVLPFLSHAIQARFYLTDVIFKTTLVLAIITPLAFFAHARYVLRDARSALFAAALLVVLPTHIHFSRADSEFIQSMATSSLTFVVLYTALRETSRGWRALCFVLLPLFSVATYFVRPENLFFYLVDMGAIALTSGKEAPRLRRVFAAIEVTASAAFAFVVHLLVRYGSSVEQGLSFQTLRNAVSIFFDVHLNTLVNSTITPPGLTLLALFGGYCLFRRGERARTLFLFGWLAGFFVVHSFVRPPEPLMQARYHLHLVTPFLLLAASALPELLRLPRPASLAAGAYLAASPLIHLGFVRDTNFNEMHEFTFLRDASRSIPDGCTVLEFSPAVDVSHPEHVFASRADRMASRLERGRRGPAFKVVNSGTLSNPDKKDGVEEAVSPAALALIAKPPECLMVYEGLSCFSHRSPSSAIAPVCAALHDQLSLVPVASTSFRSRIYDEVNAGRVVTGPDGTVHCETVLRPGDSVELKLYRATAHGPGGAPGDAPPK